MELTILRLLAAFIALRAIGNVLKPFGAGTGLVVFGRLWPPTTPLAPLLGVVMLVYAWGLWTRRAWALPLGIAYAIFATINIVLFPLLQPIGPLAPWMYGVFAVGGVFATWCAVVLLRRQLRGHGAGFTPVDELR